MFMRFAHEQHNDVEAGGLSLLCARKLTNCSSGLNGLDKHTLACRESNNQENEGEERCQ